MRDVEDYYRDAIARLTVEERFQRVCSLFASMQRMLALQIRQEAPSLSDWEIKWRVAKRMYLTDPGAQKLLEECRRRGQPG